ncbi:uncharacterized protein LOC132553143 [Ylistrum balloti]|uniref:uncharacterized protein LOC132553143 n=1 Tax=Ylistrum balloti TaxID=509963 RepID=UPI002905BBCF|nr:uncharacterized protein LOC132553143 [Ylistrum balloti]
MDKWKCMCVGVILFLFIALVSVHHSTTDSSYTISQREPSFQQSSLQISNDEFGVENPLPSENTLRQQSVENVAEIYHRYVNDLQIFCPVKPIYAGINAGWQICSIPRKVAPVTIYFISQTKDDVIATKFLKEIAVDTHAKTVQIPRRTVQTAMTESSPSQATLPVYDMIKQPTIDILLIHAGNLSTNIVDWLDRKNALGSVDQLIVKFESVSGSSSQSDYIREILLLSRLYDQGFRIFHISRDPKPECIYKLNGRDVTGCYIIYMMRGRTTIPPIVIPSTDKLNKMSATTNALLYHSYSLSTQVLCKDVVRVGDINDGGWEVCNDTDYRPSPKCLVYSFGIARDWTFDEEVSRIYGCEVHAFDPSIGLNDHKHSEKVWFHNLGLSNFNGQRGSWQMKTLASIKQMLGHSDRVLDYVKMDIEESEWSAIADMLSSGVLKNVRQLAVEFHSPNVTPGKHYITKLGLLNQLYDNGFQLFWAHPNQMRGNQRRLPRTNKDVTVCYELYYLNTRFTRS